MLLSYHADDDTGIYKVGEIDFSIHSAELESYIKTYGYEGVKNLMTMMGFLAFRIQEAYYKSTDQKAG